MINRVVLTGRLTSDVELRKTNEGIPFTYFTLAVARSGRSDQTDFISCVAWRGTAELMNQYMNKGSLIGIEGRIEVFRRERDGQYETSVNVNASQVHFLESRATANERSTSGQNNNFGSNLQFDKETTFNASNLDTTPTKMSNSNSFNKNEPDEQDSEEKELDFSSIKL